MKLHKYDLTSATPLELIPNAASEFEIGQALKLANGAAAAVRRDRQAGIPLHGKERGGRSERLPVVRVNPQMELRRKLAAAGTALKIGDAVTLAADGIRVTATTTSGVFTVTGFEEGVAAGETVYGRVL